MFILAFLIYANTLTNSFHLDDFYRIVGNPGIQKIFPISRHFVDPTTMSRLPRIIQYRPLLPLTLSINYALGKYSVVGYHIVNILFHALSGIMVFLLCLELLIQTKSWIDKPERRRWFALFTASVFIIHPVSGICVNYISARDLVMMLLFILVSLLGYLRIRQLGDSTARWLLVIISFIFAMLCKKNAIVIPGILLVYECAILHNRLFSKKAWLRVVPFLIVVTALFAYTHFVLHFSVINNLFSGKNISLFDYPLSQLRLHINHYGLNFIWPYNIKQAPYVSPVSRHGIWILLGFVLFIFTLVFSYMKKGKYPIITFSILSYWILLIPTSSVFPMLAHAVDYRPYPSSLFLYMCVAYIAFDKIRPKYLIVGISVILVYLVVGSLFQNSLWKNEEKLWEYSVKKGGSALAHLNYAMSVDDVDISEKHLHKALELRPEYILAKINLGLLLIRKGENAKGLKLIKNGVDQDPSRKQSKYWLEVGKRTVKNSIRGILEKAKNDSSNLEAQYKAALECQISGLIEESVPFLEIIKKQDIKYKRTGFLLGYAKQSLGNRKEAIQIYKSYLNHSPDDYQANFNLAYAFMKTGKYKNAIRFFKITLRLNPDYKEVYQHLAVCNKALGKTK